VQKGRHALGRAVNLGFSSRRIFGDPKIQCLQGAILLQQSSITGHGTGNAIGEIFGNIFIVKDKGCVELLHRL